MKTNPKRALLIASIVMAITIMPLMYCAYNELYVKPFKQSHLPWEDYQPFFSSTYGTFVKTAWTAFGILWLIIVFKSALEKKVRVRKTIKPVAAAITTIVLGSAIVVGLETDFTKAPDW